MNGHPTRPEDFDLYALGALDAEEAQAFEAHLAACQQCAHKAAEARGRMALLSLAAPLQSPSPAVKRRLMRQIREDAPSSRLSYKARSASGHWWAFGWATAAAALAAITVFLWIGNNRMRMELEALREATRQEQVEIQRSRALIALLSAPDRVDVALAPGAEAPGAQHVHRRPDGFLLAHPAQRGGGGIVHQVHQAAARPASFQPVVEAAVQLHQLAKMLLACTATEMRTFSPARAHPQSLLQHPAPQRLFIDVQPVFFGQVLGSQRRPEPSLFRPGILLSNPSQHLLPELLWLGSVGTFPRTAMLQSLGTLLPISPPQTLGLPVTQLQYLCGVHYLQRFAPHPPHHFCPLQFPRAHPCPLQLDLLWRSQFRGHF